MKLSSRYYFILGFILIMSAFISCKPKAKLALEDGSKAKVECWTHSYEEEKGIAFKNYRPCSFKEFPASRGRHTFTLYPDGKCEYLEIAANDAHKMKKGNWTKEGKRLIVKKNNKVIFEFDVVSKSDDQMIVKQI